MSTTADNTATVNAFMVAPAGYTRPSIAMRPSACDRHEEYSPSCGACAYVPVETMITLSVTPLPGMESDADVLAMVLHEDGSVVDWITRGTCWETAETIATWGDLVICADIMNLPEIPLNIRKAIHAATLHLDCFGGFSTELPVSL